MATKKTEKTAAPKAASKTTAPKAAKAAKAPAAKTGPRHPHGRVTEGHGGKEALAKSLAAIGSAQNKSKDKDFIAKLESFSLPQLLDIATSGERRART